MENICPIKPPYKALILAEAYEHKSVFRPALNIYQSLVKKSEISLRVKINLGNVHFKLENYPLAIKYYKMALDQVGQNKKEIYSKIMHNIGLALVQQKLYSEAAFVFGYIVKENPDFKAYLHLILCWVALKKTSKIRRYFTDIFSLPKLDKIQEIEKLIFLISPLLDDIEEDGFNWCLDVIRITDYAWMSDNLEIARIVRQMRKGNLEEPIKFLDKFELNVQNLTENSKINLSFVYLHLKKYQQVEDLLKGCRKPKAYNNYGVLKFLQNDYNAAKKAFQTAAESNEKIYESKYNLILVDKKLKDLKKSQELCETLLKQYPFPCNLMVKYQMLIVNEESKSIFENLKSTLEIFGLSNVNDPGILRKIAEFYKNLSNYKMAKWFDEEALAINPLL
ncbi:intraflagellar transport protein 88 homolog [Episyrphus balteatus]|uniref:intraflagellar transport protein 88 homolog n=1 Tax=Episyrphus balteatus TaxID=286459 RepID=UPI0024857BCC|nr:intraflagellar transport protein 88 homolog [Episyrphus balteatus]